MSSACGKSSGWTLWLFIWIAALIILFHCILDLFSDPMISGWARVGWAFVLVLTPWFGVFFHITARRRGIDDRQSAAVAAAQDREQ